MSHAELAKKLRGLESDLRRAGYRLDDCCHGEDARDALDEAADDVAKLARELELRDADELRAQLREGA